MKSEEQLKQASRIIEALSASLSGLADKKVPTLAEFGDQWIEQQLARTEIRESTKASKRYQWSRYLRPILGTIPVDQVGNHDWNALVKMTQSDYPTWRITRYFNPRKTLNEILLAAKTAGHRENTPKLDNPDEKRNVGRVLTDREKWWILRHTTYPIFRVIFYTFFKHGYRPREQLKWERSMIRWIDGRMWIDVPATITKTGRSRLAPVNQSAAKHICRLMKENPNSRFVFTNRIHPDKPQLSYHGAWATACRKVREKHPEFKHTVPYDSRRTKITDTMIEGKISPVYLGMLLDTSVKQIESTYTKADAKTLEALVQ